MEDIVELKKRLGGQGRDDGRDYKKISNADPDIYLPTSGRSADPDTIPT